MLFDKNYIKQETRNLWKNCFQDSEEFLDLYFDDKYTDAANMTIRIDGTVGAAVQVFPYRMTFGDAVMHVGYLSGLATAEAYRCKGLAARLIRDAHRRLYREGALFSFLIPGDEQLRHFYESPAHGSYWTASFRCVRELTATTLVEAGIEVTQPDEWGSDLYVFYHKQTQGQPYMLHPSEKDFYAALADCDLSGGRVLVAHKKSKVVGLCLSKVDTEGNCIVRTLVFTDEVVKNCLVHHLQQQEDVKKVLGRFACPQEEAEAEPYAMARVVNVETFLKRIISLYPSLELHIGVDQDMEIPENNGYYRLAEGKVMVTEERPDYIVTPGGLAALFLGSHPMALEMMLDE